jgi:hypothetical protein
MGVFHMNIVIRTHSTKVRTPNCDCRIWGNGSWNKRGSPSLQLRQAEPWAVSSNGPSRVFSNKPECTLLEENAVNSASLMTAISCQQPVSPYVRGVNKQIIVVGNKFDLSRPFAFFPSYTSQAHTSYTQWCQLHEAKFEGGEISDICPWLGYIVPSPSSKYFHPVLFWVGYVAGKATFQFPREQDAC